MDGNLELCAVNSVGGSGDSRTGREMVRIEEYWRRVEKLWKNDNNSAGVYKNALYAQMTLKKGKI